MGDRYWVSGVQLGILKAYLKMEKWALADKLIDRIIEDQMVEKK